MEEDQPNNIPSQEEIRKLRLYKHESKKCLILLYILLATTTIDTHDKVTFITTFSLMRNNYNSIITQISNHTLLQKVEKINKRLLKTAANCFKHLETENVINFYIGISTHPSN